MLQQILNHIRGHVTVKVESGFPERVINLCAAREIPFWDLSYKSPLQFTFTMTRSSFKRLRKVSGRLDASIKIVDRQGLPFFVGQFKRRYVLVAGLLLTMLLSFFGSFFIWDFEIEGNERVSDAEILRALQEYGVGLGTFGYSVRSDDLRNHILLEIPELSYIAVNVKGCRAYVQIRERIEVPEMIDKRESGNTIAVRDGLVTAVEPYDGEKLVLPGTMVTKGQMLISGVVEEERIGTRFLRGMGKIYATTWYDLSVKTTKTMEQKTYTGKKTTTLSICWGKNRLNFYPNSSIYGGSCDKITNRTQLTLPGGIALPITIVTETYYQYTLTETERDMAAFEEDAYKALKAYMVSGMDEGEVQEENHASAAVGDTMETRLTATCHEQIGRFIKILSEETEKEA